MSGRHRLARFVPAFAIIAVVIVTSATSARASGAAGCRAGSQEPSLAQIQQWVKEYYPGFLVRSKSSGKVAVGFVLDTLCNVRRHGAAFLPDTGWSEDLIMTVFPDIRRKGERAGLADGVPPQMQGGKRDQYFEATYIVLR